MGAVRHKTSPREGGKKNNTTKKGAGGWERQTGAGARSLGVARPQAAEKGKKTRDTQVSLSKMGVTAVSPCAELLPQPTTGELPVHWDGKAVP